MRAGRLRHRIVLQSPTRTRDSTGGFTTTWTNEATVWAAIEPLSGREFFEIKQIQAETSVRVIIRHRDGITTDWRISHGGKFYDITGVINESERDRMITLFCSEGVRQED